MIKLKFYSKEVEERERETLFFLVFSYTPDQLFRKVTIQKKEFTYTFLILYSVYFVNVTCKLVSAYFEDYTFKAPTLNWKVEKRVRNKKSSELQHSFKETWGSSGREGCGDCRVGGRIRR